MKDAAARVMHAALVGGNELTPLSASVVIRSALMECIDSTGKVNIQCLYELTCELEKK